MIEESKNLFPSLRNRTSASKSVLWMTEGIFHSLEERLILEGSGIRDQDNLSLTQSAFTFLLPCIGWDGWGQTDELKPGEVIQAALVPYKRHHDFTWHIMLWNVLSFPCFFILHLFIVNMQLVTFRSRFHSCSLCRKSLATKSVRSQT